MTRPSNLVSQAFLRKAAHPAEAETIEDVDMEVLDVAGCGASEFKRLVKGSLWTATLSTYLLEKLPIGLEMESAKAMSMLRM